MRRALPAALALLIGCGRAPDPADPADRSAVREQVATAMQRYQVAARSVKLLGALAGSASSQRPTHPAPCPTTAPPDENGGVFSFVGLKLGLHLPPQLRPVLFSNLGRVAKRTHAPLEQVTPADSIQLAAAWEAPGKSDSEIRQVLLYQVRPGFVPTGRPCALVIAGAAGLVFRTSLGSVGQSADEHWAVAYWPGFILAAFGRSFNGYDVILGVLRSVTLTP